MAFQSPEKLQVIIVRIEYKINKEILTTLLQKQIKKASKQSNSSILVTQELDDMTNILLQKQNDKSQANKKIKFEELYQKVRQNGDYGDIQALFKMRDDQQNRKIAKQIVEYCEPKDIDNTPSELSGEEKLIMVKHQWLLETLINISIYYQNTLDNKELSDKLRGTFQQDYKSSINQIQTLVYKYQTDDLFHQQVNEGATQSKSVDEFISKVGILLDQESLANLFQKQINETNKMIQGMDFDLQEELRNNSIHEDEQNYQQKQKDAPSSDALAIFLFVGASILFLVLAYLGYRTWRQKNADNYKYVEQRV